MAARYTRRQRENLTYIYLYTQLHGVPPAEAEIGAHFGVSPPAVHQMIGTLERRGLIDRTPYQARSIRVRVPSGSPPGMGASQTAPALSFAGTYPAIFAWLRLVGWIELGPELSTGTPARAGDEGGMVWSGGDPALGPVAWLVDMEQGVSAFMDEQGIR